MKTDELKKLEKWIGKIEDRARQFGLKFRPQNFTVCSGDKILEKEAHLGGYDLYSHWSYGKHFSKYRTLHEHKFHFLPYEMVINTDACDACLLENNPIVNNLMIVAHVYGHNDFFCNNLMFKDTEPRYIQMYLREGGRRIASYIRNPRIGLANVESLLDAAHAVWMTKDAAGKGFLEFALRDFSHLSAYERDVLKTVETWAGHVQGNMKTKVMNEGWATYWHLKITESFANEIKADFGPAAYTEMLDMHRDVIRMPSEFNKLNPYRVGLFTWEKIWEQQLWDQKFAPVDFFNIRSVKTDVEFLKEYFQGKSLVYDKFLKPLFRAKDIKEKVDVDAEMIKYREYIIKSCGENLVPRFNFWIEKTVSGKALMLEHIFDGRELERGYVLQNTIKLIQRLWPSQIVLKTIGMDKSGQKNIALIYEADGRATKIIM